MAALDSRLDDLYKLPPDEFVAARNALAKSLTGDDAKRVKGLAKPTIVPWAVNQVYWHARDVYTRLLKAGEKLRDAQLAALKGRTADVRGATVAHRQALADAVKAASRLAGESGAHADAELLARMFEALSLQKDLPEPHGRLTRLLQPQGFEALAGVAIKPSAAPKHVRPSAAPATGEAPRGIRAATPSKSEIREQRARERQAAAAARRHDAAVKAAEAKLAHAKKAEADARAAWERASSQLEEAENAARELKRQTIVHH